MFTTLGFIVGSVGIDLPKDSSNSLDLDFLILLVVFQVGLVLNLDSLN